LHSQNKNKCNVTKRFICIAFLCVGMALAGHAEVKYAYRTHRNEMRIGWGDQLFETLMWHKPTHFTSSMPTTYRQVYHENYIYSQHIWLEYQYRFNHWLGLGAMFDGSGVSWTDVTRDGAGKEVSRDPGHCFFNIVIMPVVRFTYFHHPNVNLYSAIGVGMDINGGTEVDGLGRNTLVGAAVNVTVFGVSANYQRWFWTVDFGGLTALRNPNTIFMAASRIINVGFGVRY